MVNSHPKYNYINYGLLIVSVSIFTFLLFWFNFTQDDAYISFRYAANLIDGHGLVYNIGERVEGFTNFLWTMLLSIGYWAGLKLPMFSKILGALFGTGSLIATYYLSIELFGKSKYWNAIVVLLVACMPSFSYWSISGMETPLFTFLLVMSLLFYFKGSVSFGLFLGLATLTRPEGILILFAIMTYEVIIRRSFDKRIKASLVLYFLILVPFLIFKYCYYGAILPNTFYAKVGFTLSRFNDGLEYIARYGWHYLGAGAFLLPGIIALKRADWKFKAIVSILLLYGAYILFIGGDVLKVHRFFIPIMPLIALTIIYGIKSLTINRYIVVMCIVIIIGWQVVAPFEFFKTYHLAETRLVDKMEAMGQNLLDVDNSEFSVAASTIGALGYKLKGHRLIDMLGLTDSTIARHPEINNAGFKTTWKERNYNISYLIENQPDYIIFSTGSKPSSPPEKALFMYSAFLNNYRTITFKHDGNRNDIFKRYYNIGNNIVRDINPEFVKAYSDGLSKRIAGDYNGALRSYKRALSYLPDSVYSLARYYVAECYKLMKDHPRSHQMLKELAKGDSLTYEVYKDLYVYEYLATNNKEKAAEYRSRIENLMPWYVNSLDSLVMRWRQ